MKILKASAGSGKTYSLTREYIRLLLQSDAPDSYRHILAVTFTNKATDEMKRRILKELHVLATAPEKSPYLGDFVPKILSTKRELKDKAEHLLTSIVHDYSAFAVSTIDKFFQQTLRAFSREIGQFSSYQVELDKDSLVDDAVASVLDNLSDKNRVLLNWVIRGVKEDLRTSGKFTLDRRLKEMAMSVVSNNKAATMSRDELDELEAGCRDQISTFLNKVSSTAQDIVSLMQNLGIDPADTNRGFMKALYTYTDPCQAQLLPPLTPSFIDKACDSEKWFAKSKAHLLPMCEVELYDPLQAFCKLMTSDYKVYTTAMTIKSQIYGLGMAAELREAFVKAQKERGVISIEDTNNILHEVIDGTDTPFLYEKLGVRLNNFLLDEFQDTSRIQWDNMLPLLKNSDANGDESLVVGDVKQSIYRWRGSDWKLLGEDVQKEFHVREDNISVLDGNYRTCRAIVDFNNRFFPWAAGVLDTIIGNDEGSPNSIRDIYADVNQTPKTANEAEGIVNIRFVENTDAEMDEIISTVRDAASSGARYGDIAILVRGNAEGSAIAERLVAEGIPVISDDSLYVKSSVTVRRLVSQLAIVDNPARADEHSVDGYMAVEMGIEVPKYYHCLTDLAESILAELKKATPELFDAEVPFIQAFMDWMEDWTTKNGNLLGPMLHDWAEAQPKIASPEHGDSVRVMTVHKSKGLEFPYVILPYAEKITLYKPSAAWCKPELRGTELERIAGDNEFRASLTDASANSLFGKQYAEERSLQAIDGMNVLYVAMTRAKYSLKVISAMPPKAVADAAAQGSAAAAKNLSQILYAFVGGDRDYVAGQKYEPGTHNQQKAAPYGVMEIPYACSTNDAKRRMVFRTAHPVEEEPELEPTLF